ncbi:hypothetical protein CC1G_14938 [Coprinopsis cinerea okayama7|uniref:Uncharacterized protein n=1 Tax=Coprinopsis cinerea (strain Okayama-7 / 130 / ATCC MYA-4618 / FGSC 9003) TaxID=240176 RepID=D6RP01_COPC7|nr:hypothetical protein CC1G_14938 [Coprinopsis cinerea okayama7\|eukprot:XP_002910607.1 hypothetical protein CC1G_14938 [Coprinopsis cinerea okayama7\
MHIIGERSENTELLNERKYTYAEYKVPEVRSRSNTGRSTINWRRASHRVLFDIDLCT